MPRTLPPVGYVAPMLPTLVDIPPEGDDWIHEIKYDGYRTELTIRGSDIHAYTRNGHDWTEKYELVVASARALRCRSAILDGEMCVQNAAGVTDFRALRRAVKGAPGRAHGRHHPDKVPLIPPTRTPQWTPPPSWAPATSATA